MCIFNAGSLNLFTVKARFLSRNMWCLQWMKHLLVFSGHFDSHVPSTFILTLHRYILVTDLFSVDHHDTAVLHRTRTTLTGIHVALGEKTRYKWHTQITTWFCLDSPASLIYADCFPVIHSGEQWIWQSLPLPLGNIVKKQTGIIGMSWKSLFYYICITCSLS